MLDFQVISILFNMVQNWTRIPFFHWISHLRNISASVVPFPNLSRFLCICIIWYNIKVVRAHFPWNNLYSPGIFNDNDVDFILLYKMEHQIDFFLEKGLIRKQLHHYLFVENSFCKARNRIPINTTRHAEKNFVFKF